MCLKKNIYLQKVCTFAKIAGEIQKHEKNIFYGKTYEHLHNSHS